MDGGVFFAVWAPNARRVSVVGDFNGWRRSAHPMRRHELSGIWDKFVPGLAIGALYKFAITARDGAELPLKADPFGFYSERRPGTASAVWDMASYRWHSDWHARSDISAPQSIYEVHLGSWRRRADGSFMNYREIARELVPYAKDLGFTHLELAPVMEHPLDESWGYQPTGLFAPTSRFGTPDDFKYFVDFAHENGMGVILDWVGAHFPRDAHGLANFDGRALYEYSDPKKASHPDWGTNIYDFGRPEVAGFLVASALFWAREYRADGLRFDAVASMLYLDYSKRPGEWLPNRFGGHENLEAIEFIHRVNSELYAAAPHMATYAEESTGWGMVSAPVHAGGLGFGYKWNMGWMHDVLDYFKREPVYRRHHHYGLLHTFSFAFSENFVLPFSHDEVVHCKGSLLGRMPGGDFDRFATLRAMLAFMWVYPGRKLLFMGDEFGASAEWSESRALDWAQSLAPAHRGIAALVRDLNSLYVSEPDLHSRDSSGESLSWVSDDADRSIFVFRRGNILAACNFTPVLREDYPLAPQSSQEVWDEILSTDSFAYHGGGTPANGKDVRRSLTLPPLSVRILKKRN
jgi:1,4-alpha-glucan branching enzyme